MDSRAVLRRTLVLIGVVALTVVVVQGTAAQPAGEAVLAFHVTIAPTWFDPSTAPPQITPFGILHALHDGLVKPLPGQKMGNSLAESWTESPDGLTYEFKLRRGLKFHNGEPVTTEDVKFSFDRYKGAGATELHARVREVEVVRRDPRLTLLASRHASIFWIEFTEQWDPKSPWHDKRLRIAVNHAIDRQAINEAACLGFCPPAGVIVPRVMDFALQVEPPAYDPPKARQLLADASYPNGIDAGELVPIPPFFTTGEAVVNYLNAVGIRVKMRQMERATFYTAWREKKLRPLFITGAGNSGNAASRVQEFISSKGSYAYGGYPDIDDLFEQQARERDTRKREALLHRIQQLTIDRVMFAPIMDFRALMGVGPRVTEHTITSIHNSPFPSYEDVRPKD